ncbi:MAG: hypothetical protein J4224_03720 [Candidatus Diapherotrites archaeon]|uniref:Uncharacterized protein n=1 Tax=Candidatus Iainarchaeum sp. TaxID=3101447 RepID=A0A7J4IVU6_9ARCH|nr:MAG: hypothetical protein QT03_C0001G0745 [archaeon GW2011_AR10]MBS3059501.1 hypothetical protein [Candidatus Diapherotrites archaeon]HIH08930.1 hypothetical protein [Candidatus Diapherotrites archaeon]
MNENQLIYVPLNFIMFLVGLAVGFFLELNIAPFTFGIHPAVDAVVLTFGVFVLSIVFYGYLNPVIFLYIGLLHSGLVSGNPIGVVMLLLPLLVASYGGGMTAGYLAVDLHEEGNLFEHKIQIAAFFFGALFLALVIGLLYGFLPNLEELDSLIFYD